MTQEKPSETKSISSSDLVRCDLRDRSKWPRGPWDNEPEDRIAFVDADTNYHCLMLRNHCGAWCGYVAIPKAHRAAMNSGLSYDDYAVSVHGGLTYADHCSGDPNSGICHAVQHGEEDAVIWLGFDTAHSGDIAPGYTWSDGVYRDKQYVRQEVLSLAKQLKALE